jgi:hypothetical protein
MTDTTYNEYKKNLADAAENWPSADYRALLLVGAVTINPDHDFVAGVLAANTEATDASYARVALGSKTNTLDDTNDRANLDAATIDFTTLDLTTPTAMVVFRQVTNDADSPAVAVYDSNFGATANGAGYTVTIPADLLRIS